MRPGFLLYRWQFNSNPIRIQTMLGHVMGFYGLDAFTETRLAKMVVRRMRAHEALVSDKPWKWSTIDRRYVVQEKMGHSRVSKQMDSEGGLRAYTEATSTMAASTAAGGSDGDEDDEEREDDDDDGTPSVSDRHPTAAESNYGTHTVPNPAPPNAEPFPTKFSPIAEFYYAAFLLASGSYQAALSYSLRAFSRAPKDPLVCLVTACCCLARITNRQADNRHHLLVQGMGFLTLYRKLRGASALTGEDGVKAGSERVSNASLEASYNIGRAFHSIGLLHMAVPQYEAVLRGHDINEELAGGEETADAVAAGFDPYREAAYNLSLIYTINGNGRAARVLYEKYLGVGA